MSEKAARPHCRGCGRQVRLTWPGGHKPLFCLKGCAATTALYYSASDPGFSFCRNCGSLNCEWDHEEDAS